MGKIIGKSLENIPWQGKPRNCDMPVWRYSENPIIKRDAIPNANRTVLPEYSAVIPNQSAWIFSLGSAMMA